MRPITKILLLLVVAFVVYLLWPRTADMKAFDPEKLADLQVKVWQAEKANKGTDALKARFQIYSGQFHFAPIPAFQIAQNDASALKSLELSREENGDANEEARSITALTEKFTSMRKQAKLDFDPPALAREEFASMLAEYLADTGKAAEGGSPQDIAAPMARVLAGIYGGGEGDFLEVVDGLVKARGLIFQGDPSTGEPDVITARSTATEAYKLLSEIAKTPAAGAAPAQ